MHYSVSVMPESTLVGVARQHKRLSAVLSITVQPAMSRRPAREVFPEKEAHQILVERSLNVRHYMCLQDQIEAYARLEDHERKAFFLRQFQNLWDAEHEGWDWDPSLQPSRQQNPRYHRMQEVFLRDSLDTPSLIDL